MQPITCYVALQEKHALRTICVTISETEHVETPATKDSCERERPGGVASQQPQQPAAPQPRSVAECSHGSSCSDEGAAAPASGIRPSRAMMQHIPADSTALSEACQAASPKQPSGLQQAAPPDVDSSVALANSPEAICDAEPAAQQPIADQVRPLKQACLLTCWPRMRLAVALVKL